MDIVYLEFLLIWIAISAYIGSLSLPVAACAAGFWLVFVWIGNWFPPTDIASSAMIVLPFLSPFVGRAVGMALMRRRRAKANKPHANDIEEQQRSSEHKIRLEKARSLWVKEVTLTVTNTERSFDFYSKLFEAKSETDEISEAKSTRLVTRYLTLRLLEHKDSHFQPNDGGRDQHLLGLETPHLALLLSHLESVGIRSEPLNMDHTQSKDSSPSAIVVQDPDGNAFLITQSNSRSSRQLRAKLENE